MPRLYPDTGVRRVFYLKIGGDSYWAVPPFNKSEGLEWLHSNPRLKLHFQHIYWDDVPKEVQKEYLLWLMNDRRDEVDKH